MGKSAFKIQVVGKADRAVAVMWWLKLTHWFSAFSWRSTATSGCLLPVYCDLVLPEWWLSHFHLQLYFSKAQILVLSYAVQFRWGKADMSQYTKNTGIYVACRGPLSLTSRFKLVVSNLQWRRRKKNKPTSMTISRNVWSEKNETSQKKG